MLVITKLQKKIIEITHRKKEKSFCRRTGLLLTGYVMMFAVFFACRNVSGQERSNAEQLKNFVTSGLVIPNGIGVNTHFRDNPAGMKAINDLGAKWLRTDFSWKRIEKEKGVFDFSQFDILVRDARAHNIKILAILDYSNKLYEKRRNITTDQGRKAFTRFAAETVKRYHGEDIVWELWNEPNNGGFWVGNDPDLYMKLVRNVVPEIRRIDPHALIMGPATYMADLKYIESCLKGGLLDCVDIVSFHPYRRKHPEMLVDDMVKVRKLVSSFLKPGQTMPPIVNSEWGFGAVQQTIRGQALRVPRGIFLAMMERMPIHIYYDLWNDGSSATNSEHNYGLLTSPPLLVPKPAGATFMAALKVMDGFRFKKRINPDSEKKKNDKLFLLDFINAEGQHRYVHWFAAEEGEKAEWALPKEMKFVSRISMIGQTLSGTLRPGDTVVSSEEPQYLTVVPPKDPNFKVIGFYQNPKFASLNTSWMQEAKREIKSISSHPSITTGVRDLKGVIDFWIKPDKNDLGKILIESGDLKKPYITLKIRLSKKGNIEVDHWVWHGRKWLGRLSTNQPLVAGKWQRISYVFSSDGRRLYVDSLQAVSEPSQTDAIPFCFGVRSKSSNIGIMQVIHGTGFTF